MKHIKQRKKKNSQTKRKKLMLKERIFRNKNYFLFMT